MNRRNVALPPVISRRSFIERLGFGAGAILLSPIAQTLVNEARGQVTDRKVAYFMLVGNGIHPDWLFTPTEFLPPGVGPEGTQYDVKSTLLDAPLTYTLPNMFKSLEPYRNRMLLIDGLANRVAEASHSTNYGALSGFGGADGKEAEDGPPGGITIDQHIAQKIGANTARKSVLIGISTRTTVTTTSVFAAGKNMPLQHFQSPSALFSDLFGNAAPAPGAPTGGGGAEKQRIIFDTVRADVTKLQKALAGPERQKLDTYLTAMEEFEKQQKALGMALSSCSAPAAPPAATPMAPEDQFESLNSIATLALTCGVTNVVGVSIGCGPSHDRFPRRFARITAGTQWVNKDWSNVGHEDRPIRVPMMEILYQWLGKQMASTIESLKTVKIADKTLWDNSLFVLTSENGEEHHANYRRWPIALFGNAGGKLKADGRFLRFPKRGSTGARSMADLYCTIATALGVPTNDFAKGGPEPVLGPIEILQA